MTSNIPDRMFYRIKEVCSITGLKPHVLRYWEQEFKDIKPVKSSRGQRLYKKKDLDVILAIKRLLYEQRYTIDGAKKHMMDKKNMLVLEHIKDELTEVIEILKKGD
ncbi:MAG: MerR family transcriptional regulator [Deltaproteobacteria bacterium]